MEISEPTGEHESPIMAGEIKNDGNSPLTWMMGNFTAKIDVKENIRG